MDFLEKCELYATDLRSAFQRDCVAFALESPCHHAGITLRLYAVKAMRYHREAEKREKRMRLKVFIALEHPLIIIM